jgi:cytochrome c oxidase subunit IV
MGAIIGGLSRKLGKIALSLLMLAMMLLIIGGIAAVVLMIHLGIEMRGDIVALLMPGIGVLVYALCMIYEVKTIRNFSVK